MRLVNERTIRYRIWINHQSYRSNFNGARQVAGTEKPKKDTGEDAIPSGRPRRVDRFHRGNESVAAQNETLRVRIRNACNTFSSGSTSLFLLRISLEKKWMHRVKNSVHPLLFAIG
jgi:hypothetical protein